MLFTFLYALAAFLIFPTLAHAWGPATHLEYATNALQLLPAMAPAVKKLLSKYADHFLYGSIAADITIGKNARGYLYNCHNWKVPMELFHNKAKKDFQKAFMLGFLGHLAADTVAHNFFVPYKLIRSWRTKLLKHVYWEMRFDLSVPGKHWDIIEKLSNHHEKDLTFSENDALLEGHLKRTFFSFKMNKKIFNNLLILQRMDHYKKIALNIANKSTWVIEPGDVHNYKKLAQGAVNNFMKEFEHSYCFNADPTGRLKMLYARDTMHSLKMALKNSSLDERAERAFLHDIKKSFEEGLYQAVTLPTIEKYT